MSFESFKVCIVGTYGVGKTAFVNRFTTGNFNDKYVATLGCEVTPININTSQGMIKLNVWDCAGDPQFEGLKDGYYIKADAFLIFCTSKTLNSLDKYISDIEGVIPDAPKVICINKIDLGGKIPHSSLHEKYVKKGIPVYEISAKSNYNIDKPFLEVARKCLNDSTLNFL